MSSNSLLINVSGIDHPGITASLMKEIDNFDCGILDIGQSLTYGLLSLSIIINY